MTVSESVDIFKFNSAAMKKTHLRGTICQTGQIKESPQLE